MTERDIFLAAVLLPDAERAAYLAEACVGRPDVRAGVDELLRLNAHAGSFLERPPVAPDETRSLPAHPVEAPGTSLGPYRLVEVIGEGGMGSVYMAEQSAPVRRKVALKVIKPGMDTKQVVARFEAERQALALMDHPHIARVLDGGTTAAGRPYFVMELVRGLPVTAYCDQARVSIPDRLRLFVRVCRAVQHAHQKGVIHRDIKPSNVLVTVVDGQPVPKVIDFGIAKAAGAALTDRTLVTGFHQLVGTPLYMSPEQAELSGVDVDTRSDVYSLGVLLYELLTGTTPFDRETFRAAGLDEVRRIIREDEPPRPSRRVSTLAAEQSSTVAERRKVDPRQLGRLMRSELDWVVMKCLEKERNRRYDGAGTLAADVERYLTDEPVHAAPPTVTYKLRKFARRNRTGLMIGAVVVAAAFVVVGVLGWTVWDQSSRRTVAEAAAATALEESTEHHRADRPDAAMASAKRAVDTLTGVPGTEGLQADAHQRVIDLEMAERLEGLWLSALEEGRLSGPESTAAAHLIAFREYGADPVSLSVDEAVEAIRGRAVAPALIAGLDRWESARRSIGGKSDPLAAKLRAIADAADPDPWSRRIRDADRDGIPDALVTELPVDTARPEVIGRLGLMLDLAGRRVEAETLLRRAVRFRPDRLEVNLALGDLLAESSSELVRAESLAFYRAALVARPGSAVIRNKIGTIVTDRMNRPAAGAEWFREALRVRPDSLVARMNLAVALSKQGQHADALTLAREVVADAPDTRSYQLLGGILGSMGQQEDAAKAHRQAVEFEPRTARDYLCRGMSFVALGRREEALTAYKEVIRLQSNAADGYVRLAGLLAQTGADPDAQIAAYREALRIDPDNAITRNNLGVALRKKGRVREAIAEFREAIRLDPNRLYFHNNLGEALSHQGRYEEALTPYRDAIRLGPDVAGAHYNLGRKLAHLDRFDEAGVAYLRAIELSPNFAEAHCNLGLVYQRSGRYADALASLRRGHELGSKDPKWPYPSGKWVETARRLAALEPQVPTILAGVTTPTEADDLFAAAGEASRQKWYARAAELYRLGLTAAPTLADDLMLGRRASAAYAAARAGCGQGANADKLDDAARAKWRRHALEWLRTDLAGWQKGLADGQSTIRQQLPIRLAAWQTDRALVCVREAADLAKLPAEERADWARFWADVQSAVDRANATPGKKD